MPSDLKLINITNEELINKNKEIIDSFLIFSAINGEYPNYTLRELCFKLNIKSSFMHNAGNDSAYTLISILRIKKYLKNKKIKL